MREEGINIKPQDMWSLRRGQRVCICGEDVDGEVWEYYIHISETGMYILEVILDTDDTIDENFKYVGKYETLKEMFTFMHDTLDGFKRRSYKQRANKLNGMNKEIKELLQEGYAISQNIELELVTLKEFNTQKIEDKDYELLCDHLERQMKDTQYLLRKVVDEMARTDNTLETQRRGEDG